MTRVTGNQVHRLLGTMKSANWYWLFLPQNMKWFGGGLTHLVWWECTTCVRR